MPPTTTYRSQVGDSVTIICDPVLIVGSRNLWVLPSGECKNDYCPQDATRDMVTVGRGPSSILTDSGPGTSDNDIGTCVAYMTSLFGEPGMSGGYHGGPSCGVILSI